MLDMVSFRINPKRTKQDAAGFKQPIFQVGCRTQAFGCKWKIEDALALGTEGKSRKQKQSPWCVWALRWAVNQ